MPAATSVEERIILLGASAGPGGTGREVLRTLLRESVAWSEVERKALGHGVGPLLFSSLMELDREPRIPRRTMERLHGAHCRAALDNLQIRDALAELLDRLERAGVEVAVVKGAALAWTVYPDPAHRPMLDVDLFAPRMNRSETRSMLAAAGYRLESSDASLFGVREEEYCDDRSGVSLDLKFFTDGVVGEAWPHRIRLASAGMVIPTFGWEDHLLYLCGHLIKHLVVSGAWHLLWLCDIERLLTSVTGDELDWDRVVRQAGSLHLRTATYLALRLAQDLLAARVPDAVLSRLRPSALRERILGSTLGGYESAFSHPGRGGHARWLLRLISVIDGGPGLAQILRHAFRHRKDLALA